MRSDELDLDQIVQLDQEIALFLERLADGTVCVHCGKDVSQFRQVRRSYYADPCGHRQGQGSAAFFNAKIAAKRAGGKGVAEGGTEP